MPVISGKRAILDGVGSLRNWRIESTNDLQQPRASNLSDYPYIMAGNNDWRGTAQFYGYIPPIYPGSAITIKASEDTAAGNAIWSGNAMVASFRCIIDVTGARPIAGEIAFESDGALSVGSQALSDASTPTVFTSKGLAATWAGADIAHVETMEFELACQLEAYRTGGTSGTNGETRRVAGNVRASGRFTVAEAGHPMTAIFTRGTVDILRYYVNPTAYWEFKYAAIGANDGSGDREGGTITKRTYPWVYSGWKDVASVITRGHIRKPDLTYLWN